MSISPELWKNMTGWARFRFVPVHTKVTVPGQGFRDAPL
jgi:hypothetical protein